MDLEEIARRLGALDEGQRFIIVQIKEVKQEQENSKSDRARMEKKIEKLDDPEDGRVARLENNVKTLESTMDVFDKFRQRGIGGLFVLAVVVFFIAFGLTEGVKKILTLLMKPGG